MSSEVPQFTLESLCLLVADCPHATPAWTDSGVVVLRNQNIKGGRLDLSNPSFTDEAHYLGRIRRAAPQAGDLVITREAPMGEVCQIPSGLKCCLGQRQVLLRPDPSKVDGRFLLYALQSPYLQHQIGWSEGTGSTVSNLRIPVLEALQVPTPPVHEQKAIAETLGAIDDRITLLRETNATLEAIAQALFKSWFVDFDPVRAKMEGRAPEGMDEATAALFPNAFEETELGLVPRGWSIKTMADVSTVGIGKTPPRKEQHWFSESSDDVRWVSIRDMGLFGTYASLTSEYLTNEAVEKFNVRRVPDNTVIMSFKMTIGRVAITDGEMTTNEAIAHFRLSEGAAVSTEYVYLHLKQFDFTKLSSTSSIADAVNSKTVREIPVLVPSSDVMSAFQEKISAGFAILKNSEQQAQILSILRDILLPRLISGQMRIAELSEFVEAA